MQSITEQQLPPPSPSPSTTTTTTTRYLSLMRSMANDKFAFSVFISFSAKFVCQSFLASAIWYKLLLFCCFATIVNCLIHKHCILVWWWQFVTFIFAFAINWFYGIVYVFQNANDSMPQNWIIVYLIMIIKFRRFIVFSRFTLLSHLRLDRLVALFFFFWFLFLPPSHFHWPWNEEYKIIIIIIAITTLTNK